MINEKFKYSSYKEIHLFSDSARVMKVNARVIHVFSVRGQSLGTCDRNFGLCGTKIKKEEKIHTLGKYLELLKAARQSPFPFVVKHGEPIILQWPESFKKSNVQEASRK
ncbi:hypothetical protein PR048_027074 [Dryococelus australis]|uniref:Uncharacterized protein n=1 Tax=Dryococelus australis TaxID=614101 RepID=A0ABQ9GEE2_9NEOP|nr:hypothetical protein PR048_027074 [Dryococelus australis]